MCLFKCTFGMEPLTFVTLVIMKSFKMCSYHSKTTVHLPYPLRCTVTMEWLNFLIICYFMRGDMMPFFIVCSYGGVYNVRRYGYFWRAQLWWHLLTYAVMMPFSTCAFTMTSLNVHSNCGVSQRAQFWWHVLTSAVMMASWTCADIMASFNVLLWRSPLACAVMVKFFKINCHEEIL